MRYLAPDYVYTEQGLAKDQLITIDDDGKIASILAYNDGDEPHAGNGVERLPGIALLPGFVNAHSHVFQRLLRGHTHRPLSLQDSFWTWRRAMYEAAQTLDPERLYEVALRTYREMLNAGYTSVGEFHYVHHQPDGEPYAEANAMSRAILQAGRESGMRVVLLMTAYAQAGFQQAPEVGQLRFCDASVEQYLARVEALRSEGELVGLAPHSVRAVPEDWLRPIAAYSRAYGLPLHIHVDEQRAEIAQCVTASGCTPVELLERCEALDTHTTLIHATHASATEIELMRERGCTVCVCPTTEGDLGDGIAPYAELVEASIPLAIGADSNTRLDPIEELRWAEYTARMRYERRRVLIAEPRAAPGPFLLAMGTRNGARALGLNAGVLAPGMFADFIGIDLQHPTLAGWNPEDLLDVLFFGASSEVINQVWVQGRQVVQR